MSQLALGPISFNTPCYFSPTPAGAYFAAQSDQQDGSARYLLQLLSEKNTPLFTEEHLTLLHQDKETAAQMLHRLQTMGYIQTLEQPIAADEGPLEEVLPPLLASLSSSGKAILADEQGFYLAMHGFVHENAEEISALSASLQETYQRHKGLLKNNLGVNSSAFGLIDAAGNNEIGFWPLFFARTRFSLIIADLPRFNCQEYVRIINYLAIRYSH